MFKTLKNAWRQPELKNKLLFTLLIIILYRLGSAIPVPYFGVDANNASLFQGNILEFLNILSGTALAQGTMLALGVSPYITASIVMQLLTVAIPKLGEKAKQGEEGKKFINFWTRIVTIILSVITSLGYALLMINNGLTTFTSYEASTVGNSLAKYMYDGGTTIKNSVNIFQILFGVRENGAWVANNEAFAFITMVLCYCAGAAIVMWMAEKINESGIGNGISIILFANIIASLPVQISQLWNTVFNAEKSDLAGLTLFKGTDFEVTWFANFYGWGLALAGAIVVGLLLLLLLIVWMSDAERRIPIQYAKRVVGRKMYGGQSTNLPLKVNMSGVMPIIFANSIVMLPATISQFLGQAMGSGNLTKWGWLNTAIDWVRNFISGFTKGINGEYGFIDSVREVHITGANMLQSLVSFNSNGWPYLIIFLVLLIAFAFFYVAISFDPIEVANNIKNNGGAILGIRPGKPTVDYIRKILNRITLLGGLLVAVVACTPIVANIFMFWGGVQTISAMAFSGSSMMIVVGVAIETIRELEAQLSLRNYKGFLD